MRLRGVADDHETTHKMAGLVKVPQRMGIDATKLASYIQANVPEIARKVASSTGLGVQFFRYVNLPWSPSGPGNPLVDCSIYDYRAGRHVS